MLPERIQEHILSGSEVDALQTVQATAFSLYRPMNRAECVQKNETDTNLVIKYSMAIAKKDSNPILKIRMGVEIYDVLCNFKGP